MKPKYLVRILEKFKYGISFFELHPWPNSIFIKNWICFLGSIWSFMLKMDEESKSCKIVFDQDSESNKVNIMWMIPQYAIITIGEVLNSATGNEFVYTQVSLTIRWYVFYQIGFRHQHRWNLSWGHFGFSPHVLAIFLSFSLLKSSFDQVRTWLSGIWIVVLRAITKLSQNII